MSYKRSWLLVQEMNAAFAEPLVETEKGGTGGGGGTQLTPLGRKVLDRYRQMEADARQGGRRRHRRSPPPPEAGPCRTGAHRPIGRGDRRRRRTDD